MKQTNNTKPNAITVLANNQLYLSTESQFEFSADDPVCVLNVFVERMDFSVFNTVYSRLGRIEYAPKVLFKILVYGYMRGIYSSRALAEACRENIRFMYLLEGRNPPGHNTINRFRSTYLPPVKDQMFAQLIQMLQEAGFLDLSYVFIDGTKIEANGNKYKFVWKKSQWKSMRRLQQKIHQEMPSLLEKNGIHCLLPNGDITPRHLEVVLAKVEKKMEKEGILIVHGTGRKKTELQRFYEIVQEWNRRLSGYLQNIEICGNRNSFCKTDPDATFMHLKEDPMRNGQLKPAYNVNIATANEFIIGNYLSSERNDVSTLIPFMEKLKLPATSKVVVDAGYESEENYSYFEPKHRPELFVKPANHEIQKHKKYRTDISRKENMLYDARKDEYTCAAGKRLAPVKTILQKTGTGFRKSVTVYTCEDCGGCPLKEKCICSHSNKRLEERNKVIYASRRFEQQRSEMEKKIQTEEGILLRINRSIQAEGAFAMTKQNMGYRRFLLRGNVKVDTEWTILCIAYDLIKLIYKSRKNRLGTTLIIPNRLIPGL